MSKILERIGIGGCWNNVEPESIKPRDKVALYSLKVIQGLQRLCVNEEIRDAIDDLCDILSEWNARLLLEYNKDQPDDKCIDNIKDLLNSNDQAV
ncbi:unnamed protein product [Rhizophagus irregularis]|uniref:Uncharacterized protein n=1 Tax=Rhizophagus irregularis TaxID=588596 RepID=A0A916DXR6_9GLOM|nr:unnamed protein product [Rhizophagus irregularis]CAB5313024.1 unnamed protein product [Rhizophagus irregularis]